MKCTGMLTLILATLIVSTAVASPQSDLVSKSTKAIGYPVGGGSIKIDLKGTDLRPQASGEAKIAAKKRTGGWKSLLAEK